MPSRAAAKAAFWKEIFIFTKLASWNTRVSPPNTRAKPPAISGIGASRRSTMKPTSNASIEATTRTPVARNRLRPKP